MGNYWDEWVKHQGQRTIGGEKLPNIGQNAKWWEALIRSAVAGMGNQGEFLEPPPPPPPPPPEPPSPVSSTNVPVGREAQKKQDADKQAGEGVQTG